MIRVFSSLRLLILFVGYVILARSSTLGGFAAVRSIPQLLEIEWSDEHRVPTSQISSASLAPGQRAQYQPSGRLCLDCILCGCSSHGPFCNILSVLDTLGTECNCVAIGRRLHNIDHSHLFKGSRGALGTGYK